MTTSPTLPDPTFPPLLNSYPVEADQDPFIYAAQKASDKSLGAADVVWSRATDEMKWAIVLEPEVPLKSAKQMVLLAQVALADCLGALTPPKVAVTFNWPFAVLINGGYAAQVRAGVDRSAGVDEVPDWMTIGVEVLLSNPGDAAEPGETPDVTMLSEEGGENLDRTIVIESYSRHFLTWLNIWFDEGFKPVADAWLLRAEGRDAPLDFCPVYGEPHIGTILGFDDEAELLVKTSEGETVRSDLLSHFGKS